MFVHPDDYEQWAHWERITADTLVLRGVTSDLLLPADATRMSTSGPRARIVEIDGCGHAPALNVPRQIEAVRSFLEA
jgi:pimeloyl-ACP methyl ester carboxylesterase